MSTLSIRRVSHSEILGARNAAELIDEYAAECSRPDANPQASIYDAMEQAGALQCFGAYLENGPAELDELIGFASVVSAVMPHNGKRVATIESIFVLSAQRHTCAGTDLLTAAEEYAAEAGCADLLYTARIYSPLEKVLLRRLKCLPTHTVFTRRL
jgi:GNAT superfamily N-acetyltransferase